MFECWCSSVGVRVSVFECSCSSVGVRVCIFQLIFSDMSKSYYCDYERVID